MVSKRPKKRSKEDQELRTLLRVILLLFPGLFMASYGLPQLIGALGLSRAALLLPMMVAATFMIWKAIRLLTMKGKKSS